MSPTKCMILESPNKIKKISGFLPKNDWIIIASMGHIRNLKSGEMAIDIENNFKPIYENLKDKKSDPEIALTVIG